MRKLCKVLFSRYAISAIMILAEVLIAVLLFVSIPTSIYSFVVLAIVLEIIAFLNLINKDANPEYKVSWGAVILFLPIAGAILYFLFYTRYISKREGRIIKSSIVDMRAISQYDENREALAALAASDPLAAGKARAIIADDPLAELYIGTEAEYFPTGEEYFQRLLSDITSAKKYIFLEYFIIDEGSLWDEIHAALLKKAGEGVEIRLLFDDIGCMKTLPRKYETVLRREGISAYRFARVSPRVSSMHQNRDHRKIAVIDGNIGYTGGVNIADEYVNRIERFGHWKDGGVRLSGDGVLGLLRLFLASYDATAGDVSDYRSLLSPSAERIRGDGYFIPFGSGPAPIYRRPVAKNAFLNLINQATSYVYITTPYLIIDYDLTESLCNASCRGVDVRIITPGIPDKKTVKLMTKSAYPYLIKSGVKIYEYKEGFIHEKLLISDGKYSVIGTVNFDYRSLVHHFECGVWAYSESLCARALDEYNKTLTISREISAEEARLTFIEKIVRNAIRILAPLL